GRHFVRQAGDEQRHAGDVAVVLTRLVRRSEDDLVETFGELRLALHEGGDDVRGEIVGTNLGEGATVLSDRRSNRVDEIDGWHPGTLPHPKRTGDSPGSIGEDDSSTRGFAAATSSSRRFCLWTSCPSRSPSSRRRSPSSLCRRSPWSPCRSPWS